MVVDKNGYIDIQNDIVNISNDLVSDSELESFNQYIEDKLSNFKPTLMIYGTYNAGKSTLLNALFGEEEKAKTGDSPETAAVHGYEYNGYTIYDTPGINAPIKHEEVTNEHLSKSEIVLFVMSNDGSLEEEYVYNKISEIVKNNKPILIVLNNKKSINPDSKEAIDEINKVNINLSKIGDRNGIENIEEKVSLCMINAKTALKGKVENKKIMLKRSNILQLEKSIEELLNDAGNEEVINTLNIYIREFTEKIISQIDMKIDNPELQKVEELLTYLEKFRQKSEIELKNIIHKKMNILESGLKDMLLNQSSEEEINGYFENIIDDISNQLELRFERISTDLKNKIENFSEEMNAISIKHQNISVLNNNLIDENSTFVEDNFKKVLKNKELVTSVTKEALLKLRELKILFKGRWEKTLGKYASKFATVVNVLVGAYEVYQAFKSHNEQIEKQRQHVLSATNKSKEIADNVKEEMFNSIDEILDSVFSNLIENFRETSKKLDMDRNDLLVNKDKLLSMSHRL